MFGKKKVEKIEELEELPEIESENLEELSDNEVVKEVEQPVEKNETYEVEKIYLDEIVKILTSQEERIKFLTERVNNLEAFSFRRQ